MSWEERMAEKHRHLRTDVPEIPWREPTFRERLTRPDVGWLRLPRLLCTRCYEWRRDGPNRLKWFLVCNKETGKLCGHRHHDNEVWMAYSF